MCFSTEVSFGAGIVLSTVGVLAIRESKPNQIYFALIPFLFGIQQFIEGFIWVIHTSDRFNYLLSYLNLFYLFFAFIIWPFWIPLSIFKLKNEGNTKLIKIALGIGILVSLYLGHIIFFYEIRSEIICYHIKYVVSYVKPFSGHSKIIGLFYLAAITIPTFFHPSRYIKLFGILLIVSYVLSKLVYTNYFTSVWCFFAAIISVFVLFSLNKINKV